MNKYKVMAVCIFILSFILLVFTIIKIKKIHEYDQKIVLANDLQKALYHMMFDLSQVREASILDVPPDGLWHDHITFIRTGQGALEYLVKEGHLLLIDNGKASMISDNITWLGIRRYMENPGILQVQIKAQRDVSLLTNFRIRLRH